MKKTILISLILISIGINLQSQITLENDYSGSAYFSSLAANSYFSLDFNNSSCLVYDEDHVLTNTISLEAPSNMYLYDALYLSTNLFNTDDLLELVVVYYNYIETSDTSGYYIYHTQVVNENGSVLLDIPNGTYSYLNYLTDGSIKFMVYKYDFSFSSYPTNTLIYGLGGDLSSDYEYGEIKLENPFPNPTSNLINIPYHIENDAAAELILMESSGRKLNSYDLDSHSESIQINTSGLKAGQYIYYIETAGRKTLAKKIIVR